MSPVIDHRLIIHTRAEIVRWVAESNRPFAIVEDRAFQSLMKTGRPEYWIPSRWTVGRDVQKVFARTRTRIGKMLKVSLFDHKTTYLTRHPGIQRRVKLYHRLLDIAQSQSNGCFLCPLRARRRAHGDDARCCRASNLALGPEPCEDIC